MKKRNRRKVIAVILTLTMLFGSVQTVFATEDQVAIETEFMTNYFQANQTTDELKAIEASLERYGGYDSEKDFETAMSELSDQLLKSNIAGQKSVYFDGGEESTIEDSKEEGIVKIVIDAKAQLVTETPVDVMFVVDHSGTMNSNALYKSSGATSSTSPSMNSNLFYRTVYKITAADGTSSYVSYYFNPHEFGGMTSWSLGMIGLIDTSFINYVKNELSKTDNELSEKIQKGKYDNLGDNKRYPYQDEIYSPVNTENRVFEFKDGYEVNAYEEFTDKEVRSTYEKDNYIPVGYPIENINSANPFESPSSLADDIKTYGLAEVLNKMDDPDFNYDRLYMTKAITMNLAETLIKSNDENRVGTVNFAGDVKSQEVKLSNYNGGKEDMRDFSSTTGYYNTNWTAGLAAAKTAFSQPENKADGRDQYVIFISDGKPTTGGLEAAAKKEVDALKAMGVNVISIGINLTTTDDNKMKSLETNAHYNVESAADFYSKIENIKEETLTTSLSPIIEDTVGDGFNLLIDGDHPLTLEWKEEGSKPQSINIGDINELSKYGVTLAADNKTITWDTSRVNEGKDTVVSGARISFYQNFDESQIDSTYFESEKTTKFDTNNGKAVVSYDKDPTDDVVDMSTELENPGAIVVSGLSTITLNKDSNPEPGTTVDPGQAITYNLTLQNEGNVDVRGLEIKDFIPAGTEYSAGGILAVDNSVTFSGIEVLKATEANEDGKFISYSEAQSFTVEVTTVEEDFDIVNIATFGKAGVSDSFNGGDPALESNEVLHVTASTEEPPVPPVPPVPVPPTPVPPTPVPPTPVPPVVPPAVTIPPVATPLADGPTTIEDTEVPLANGAAWSLLDLILTVVTGLLAVSLLITYFTGRKEEEEEEYGEIKRKGLLRILSAVPMIGAIILFILTQDMTLPMIIVDEWTIVFAAITLVQGAITFFSRKKVEEDDDQAMA